MSTANLVDLGNSAIMDASIIATPVLSGSLVAPNSGAVIGDTCDFLNANNLTNLFIAGQIQSGGQMRIQVQTSDTDTSGTFTDPTSGFSDFPGAFKSGGILWVGSGNNGGVFGAGVSGQFTASGFAAAQGFQRPHRFVRANLLSGDAGVGGVVIGFIAQSKRTGSGGGFTFNPSSGVINV